MAKFEAEINITVEIDAANITEARELILIELNKKSLTNRYKLWYDLEQILEMEEN